MAMRIWTAAAAAAALCAAGAAAGLERISVNDAGTPGNAFHALGGVSRDGRFVVFSSTSTNLVPGDTNGTADVFLRDRLAGTTRRVSVSAGGAQGNDDSGQAAVSADGRWVAFDTLASNLGGGMDSNSSFDVYLKDMETGAVTLVSRAMNGGAAGSSFQPSISDDGVWVAFVSSAGNIVPDDGNSHDDVFVYNRLTAAIRRLSVRPDGGSAGGQSLAARISGDGSLVVFASYAPDLVPAGTTGRQVYAAPVAPGPVELITIGANGHGGNGDSLPTGVSTDGRLIGVATAANDLAPGLDADSTEDVYIFNRENGVWSFASLGPGGAELAFPSSGGSITDDARFVTLETIEPIAPGDVNPSSDVYVRDRATGVFTFMNETAEGEAGSGRTQAGVLARDGLVCVFMSDSANLASPPTDGFYHIYARTFAPPCAADLDGDGHVSASDLAALLGSWGPGGGPADLTGDGQVGAPDLAVLLGWWGPCP